ncbi:hypothetical protein WJX72_000511 [[Myrmecia] bisecta]|uniref:Uncharacterized protein n=1 Tax=[Myrmecia] bisecta TaxID=41462 RepID=A0AAW1P8C7_9CHLO
MDRVTPGGSATASGQFEVLQMVPRAHRLSVAAAYRTEAEFLAAAEQFTPFDPPNEPHVAQRNLTVVVQGIGMSALHAVISTLGLPSEKFQKLEAACLTGEQRRPISNKTLKYFDFTGEERRSVLLAVLKKEQEMQREEHLPGWQQHSCARLGQAT